MSSATKIAVPLLDLQAQYRPIREELLAAVTRVCDSGRFIMGAEVEALEREVAEYLQVREAIGVSSGTDALLVAMMAMGIGSGDEVITSTYSFFATAGCITRLGATPRLVDIDPETCNLDPALVQAALSPKTKAIIPVHLYGLCAEMDPLVAVAESAGVPVIEDACQALGATYRGRQAGSMGQVGCFSFFPSKNLGAFGDAGFVTATDAALAKKLRLIRTHGMEPKYYHHIVGANFRIDAIQAAVLRVKLPKLAGWSEGRRRNAARYRALFAACEVPEIVLPIEAPDRTHIYNQFVIRAPQRDKLKEHLDGCRIGTEVYYPVPFHLQDCFKDLGYQRGAFPEAEAAAKDSLALPIYPELTEAQQSAVVDAIRNFYRG